MTSSAGRLIRKLFTNSPQWVVRKAVSRAASSVVRNRRFRRDSRHGTFASNLSTGPLFRLFDADDLQEFGSSLQSGQIPTDVLERYLDHRFNLLGSGWVRVHYGMRCGGLGSHRYQMSEAVKPDREGRWLNGRINDSNLEQSQRIWRLVDADYVPIDWHLDFKSGFRWSEKTWFQHIPLAPRPGVDIKVPWELARGQHLPQLALAGAARSISGKSNESCDRIAREFRNQVLDFLATNPVRFGVNWQCAMDVGIRIVNWLIAWDLFCAAGVQWDEEFQKQFAAAVYLHGRHIAENLEWSPDLRTNHYLADVAGLLFAARYLPRDAETDAWSALAVQELVCEVGFQFNEDGTNYEASTSYHRLSAEIVVWSTALVLALNDEKRRAWEEYDHRLFRSQPRLEPAPLKMYPLEDGDQRSPFPPWYFQRLQKMAEFSMHVTKPTGRVHQAGDNDSGRFLNIQPDYIDSTTPDGSDQPEETHLDHRSLVAVLNGMFPRADFEAFCGPDRLETKLIRRMIGKTDFVTGPDRNNNAIHVTGEPSFDEALAGIDSDSRLTKYEFQIALPGEDYLKNVNHHAYRDFGLYIWRSPRFYLAVRCGPVGQNGNGGHAHSDQLAIELSVDDRDWIADPGTCLYLPDPEKRNSYRSVAAHFAPHAVDGREPGRLDLGLFQLETDANARCLSSGPDGFLGCHNGFGRKVYRAVRFTSAAVLVTDYAEAGLKLKPQPSIGPQPPFPAFLPFSPGYGIVRNSSISAKNTEDEFNSGV